MNSKVVQDKIVYTGQICRVHSIGLEIDDGVIVSRDLVEFADAVVVVPLLPDGSVVLIRNERFAVGERLLELPAGKLDGDEQPETCAARELAEETGYAASALEKLGGFYSAPGAITEYLHVFAATGLTPGPQRLEAHEQIAVEVAEPERVDELIASGHLHDAKSIAAWTLWRLRKGRK